MKEISILPCGLISRRETARFLGLKAHTLACWNSSGRYDEYFDKRFIGGRVYYDFEAVKRFANVEPDCHE